MSARALLLSPAWRHDAAATDVVRELCSCPSASKLVQTFWFGCHNLRWQAAVRRKRRSTFCLQLGSSVGAFLQIPLHGCCLPSTVTFNMQHISKISNMSRREMYRERMSSRVAFHATVLGCREV